MTTLVSLVPFLERELIDTLPYVVASTLINFPSSLVEDVVDVLCWNLLPFAITNVNHPSDNCVLPSDTEMANLDYKRDNYASNSTAAILMMVYQFAKDNSAIHRYRKKIRKNIWIFLGICLGYLWMDVFS